MEFSIEFYETEGGTIPIRDFLDALEQTDPGDHASVVAGIVKLRQQQNHREPLSKAIGDKLYELRHVGKLNTRILWFFMRGRRIILAHAIRNKGQKIARQDLTTAHKRMEDWLRREENTR